MTTNLKTIVAAVLPHVRAELMSYCHDCAVAQTPTFAAKARGRIEGYLLGAYKSGDLLHQHFVRLSKEVAETGGYRIIGACFEAPKPQPPITEGERSLYRYKFEATGSFEKSFWSMMMAADSTNLALIAKGFPEHAEAMRRYANESGYWQALVKRINGGE